MTSEEGPSKRRNPAIQVWVDAQLPPSLARWLHTEHGVDALHIHDLGLYRGSDALIYEQARSAESTVILITKDEDFTDLLGRHGPPPQVVWIRCGNVKNRELRRIVLETWPKTEQLLADGESLVEIRRRSLI